MSKISRDNKKAVAEGKVLKGKAAKTAAAKKHKKESAAVEEAAKQPKLSIKNGDRCCHCKSYIKGDIISHMCKLTGKPTPRKATCDKQVCRD